MKPLKTSLRGSSDDDALGFVATLVIIVCVIMMVGKCSCTFYEGGNEDITVKLYSESGEVVGEHKVDAISTDKGEIRYKIGATETIYKGQYLVIRKPKPAAPKAEEKKEEKPVVKPIESPQPVEKEKP